MHTHPTKPNRPGLEKWQLGSEQRTKGAELGQAGVVELREAGRSRAGKQTDLVGLETKAGRSIKQSWRELHR